MDNKRCNGWQIVCPDGHARHPPCYVRSDALNHASELSRDCDPSPCHAYDIAGRCPQGTHSVRAVVFEREFDAERDEDGARRAHVSTADFASDDDAFSALRAGLQGIFGRRGRVLEVIDAARIGAALREAAVDGRVVTLIRDGLGDVACVPCAASGELALLRSVCGFEFLGFYVVRLDTVHSVGAGDDAFIEKVMRARGRLDAAACVAAPDVPLDSMSSALRWLMGHNIDVVTLDVDNAEESEVTVILEAHSDGVFQARDICDDGTIATDARHVDVSDVTGVNFGTSHLADLGEFADRSQDATN